MASLITNVPFGSCNFQTQANSKTLVPTKATFGKQMGQFNLLLMMRFAVMMLSVLQQPCTLLSGGFEKLVDPKICIHLITVRHLNNGIAQYKPIVKDISCENFLGL